MEKGKIIPPTTFPTCLVWTPIPVISWLVPFIGHMGICTSKGVIMDFMASQTINSGKLTFGSPARYIQLDPSHIAKSAGATPAAKLSAAEQTAGDEEWDAAVHRTVGVYQECHYNFLTTNCHVFVSHFLNEVQYGGRKNWNMVLLATWMALLGRFPSVWGFIKTFLPCVVIMVVGIYFGTWKFLTAYTGVILPITAWFFIYTFCINRQASRKPAKSPA